MMRTQPFKSFCFVLSTAMLAFLAVRNASARADVDSARGDASGVVHERLSMLAASVATRMNDPASSVDTRDLGNAAFTVLLHGGDAALAQREIDRAFVNQDLRANSPTYGQITPLHSSAKVSARCSAAIRTACLRATSRRYGLKS
jgi:hypothetical protein